MKTRINLTSVDRILVVVDEPPPNLREDAFARSLELSASWYRDAVMFAYRKPAKDQHHAMALTYQTATRLTQLLTDDLLEAMGPLSTTVDTREFLAELIETVNQRLKPPPAGDLLDMSQYRAGFKQRSPFEWLAGYCLPDVYELHLRRKASPTTNSEFVRFAEMVLAELQVKNRGKTYSRATISRALTTVRSGRPRRESAPFEESDDGWQFHQWCWESALLYSCGLNWNRTPSCPLWRLLDDLEARRDASSKLGSASRESMEP